MSFGGNFLSLSTKTCKIYGEGTINLGAETGQFEIASAGVVIACALFYIYFW